MSDIRTQRLSCGTQLLTERMPGVRSAAFCWMLPLGTARDPENQVGMSAMLEELLLRGTQTLSSREIADAFDTLGVSRGTSTGIRHNSITAQLLGARLDATLPMLVDMVRSPRLGGDDFTESLEATRALCLQSLASIDDEPRDKALRELLAVHFGSPINRHSLGTRDGILAVTPQSVASHYAANARPEGSIIAVAGDVDADALFERLNALLEDWQGNPAEITPEQTGIRGTHHLEQASNQVHIALSYDAPREIDDPSAWYERLGTAVLSGGMSGRLFTEVREKRGLCYSVYASYASGKQHGRVTAYAGTTPERAQETLDVLVGELQRIRTSAGAIDASEFERARTGLKSKLVLSGESSRARASALASDYDRLGRCRSLDELARKVDSITLDQLNSYLQSTPLDLSKTSVVTIGPAPLKFSA
ncbi:MAG: M16 family metallopeptidase [Phycisphaerales bacterium]